VLAIVGLVLFSAAQIGLRFLLVPIATAGAPDTLLTTLEGLGPLAIMVGSQAGSVGGILALIRTAQIRRWRWFVSLLVALLVTAVSGLFLNTWIITQVAGVQRTVELTQTPTYVIVTSAVFCVSFVAQIVYGLFGPDEPIGGMAAERAQSATV
jgi:hypothetical protein